jgi:hypothetical protein
MLAIVINLTFILKIDNSHVVQNSKEMKVFNTDLPFDPAIPLLGIYPKDCDTGYSRGTCNPCLLQHYLQEPSYGNSQDAPPLTTGLRKCGIYIQWNFMQP